jgi:hypothetical protein
VGDADDSDVADIAADFDLRVVGETDIVGAQDGEDSDAPLIESAEWEALLTKYNIKIPTTALEKERDELFRSQDGFDLDSSTDELDLYQFRRIRYEGTLLTDHATQVNVWLVRTVGKRTCCW